MFSPTVRNLGLHEPGTGISTHYPGGFTDLFSDANGGNPFDFTLASTIETVARGTVRTLRRGYYRHHTFEELYTEGLRPFENDDNFYVRKTMRALHKKEQVIAKVYEKHEQLIKALPRDAVKRIQAFQSKFNAWDLMRNETINDLKSLVITLNAQQEQTNTHTAVAGTVGAVGAGAAVAGIALAPFTFGASVALVGAGTVAAAGGTGVVIAAQVNNKVVEKIELEKVEPILDNDRRDTQDLVARLAFLRDLHELFESWDIDEIEQLKKEIEFLSNEVERNVAKLERDMEEQDFIEYIKEFLQDIITKIIAIYKMMKSLAEVLGMGVSEVMLVSVFGALFLFNISEVIKALVSMAGGSRSEVAKRVEKEVIRPLKRQQEKMQSLNEVMSNPTKD